MDRREEYTPGWKFNYWETKGVPLRIEIGPRDVKQGQVVLARRDRPGREGKEFTLMNELAQRVPIVLEDIQASLLNRAQEFLEQNTAWPTTYE